MEWKDLEFKTVINASGEKVWNTMLNHGTYEEWTAVSWPGSTYEGSWKQGTDIRFVCPDSSGTLAHMKEVVPFQRIVAEHTAILSKGGVEDRTSDLAKGWTGTLESYYFDGDDKSTSITVKLKVRPEWEQMFIEGWPAALNKLKEISER